MPYIGSRFYQLDVYNNWFVDITPSILGIRGWKNMFSWFRSTCA
jgi:hypothetical protein